MELLTIYYRAFVYGILPFIISIGLGVGFSVLARRLLQKQPPAAISLSLAFAAVGAATGYFMGSSRESAVASVTPALLTFISGVVAYQFAKQGETFEPFRQQLPLAIVSMFAAAVFAAAIAGSGRQSSEIFDRYADEYFKNEVRNNEMAWKKYFLRFERVELPLELARLKRDLNLPGAAAPEAAAPEK